MTDHGPHPAVEAFARLRGGPAATTVPRLLSDEKARVYLFRHGGADIVAKHCAQETATIEARAYGRIVPSLDLPSLKFYGTVPDDGGDWIFIEAAAGAPFRSDWTEHRRLAAEWIGAMHVRADARIAAHGLPDRSPESYCRQLHAAIASIHLHRDHPTLSPRARIALEQMLPLLHAVRMQWDAIAAACDVVPLTFVHADLQPKNLTIRGPGAEPRFIALDWEHCGWGTPAVDLPHLDLCAYREAVDRYWPKLDASAARRLQQAGRLLQLVAAVEWDTWSLPDEAATEDMGWYADRIAEELGRFGE